MASKALADWVAGMLTGAVKPAGISGVFFTLYNINKGDYEFYSLIVESLKHYCKYKEMAGFPISEKMFYLYSENEIIIIEQINETPNFLKLSGCSGNYFRERVKELLKFMSSFLQILDNDQETKDYIVAQLIAKHILKVK